MIGWSSLTSVHYFKRNTFVGVVSFWVELCTVILLYKRVIPSLTVQTSPMTATFQFASFANFEGGTIQEENETGSNEKTNTGSSQSLLESSNTTCGKAL